MSVGVNKAVFERVSSFDSMKAIAAFFVVVIHTNPFKDVSLSWFPGVSLDFILDTTARFAVPYFFIVSGYFFANSIRKYDNPPVTLIKILSRVFWIHLSWGALYYLPRFIKDPSQMHDFTTLAKEIAWVGFEVHLWFLPALMFAIAVVGFAVRYRFLKHLVYFSLVLNILGMFGDGQIYYSLFELPIWPFGTRNGIFFGLFYVAIGCYWFRNPPLKLLTWLNKKRLLLIIFILVVLQLLERWLAFELHNANPDCDYYITTIPLSLSIFLWCMKYPQWGSNKYLISLGKNSMGIYVIHVALYLYTLDLMRYLNWDQYTHNILWHMFLTPLVYFASYWLYKYWIWIRVKLFSSQIGS